MRRAVAGLLMAIILGMFDASAQSVSNHNLHQAIMDAEADTSPARQAEREKGYKEGLIDFALIRQTLITGGPPVFASALLALDGKSVRMIGFMNPYDSLESMKNFIILDRPTGCYFCKPPGWLDAVYGQQDVKEGEKPPFIEGPIHVSGTLRLWKEENDFLFFIEKARVEPYRPEKKKKKFGLF